MILGFKAKFSDGFPTNFKEKILRCTDEKYMDPEWQPKIHTIRADPHKRWKEGRSIQMCYRGKNYSILDQFNKDVPELEVCTGVQNIEIKGIPGRNQKVITIEGRQLGLAEHLLLAKNDGFEDYNRFYNWFDKDFTGRIVHWTDFRY